MTQRPMKTASYLGGISHGAFAFAAAWDRICRVNHGQSRTAKVRSVPPGPSDRLWPVQVGPGSRFLAGNLTLVGAE